MAGAAAQQSYRLTVPAGGEPTPFPARRVRCAAWLRSDLARLGPLRQKRHDQLWHFLQHALATLKRH